ncbi:uncharacterized protein EAF01_003500 [Botrytis porri]|uniref:uncharacterized protein n=1 Tax=Botrytis porri TaxID=87229 RepID=UPI0019025B08|nr:uncharacterized protein EAF01_003500 [Botrytis porri]KAF7909782.1 hypothetical protein EAF01_003500 [Botrytis porri]
MSTITCNVIDRRISSAAAGMRVVLRCIHPNEGREFEETTSPNGVISWWKSRGHPEISLLQYLFNHQDQEQMCWHMQFSTTDYFAPIIPHYISADISFVLFRGHQIPSVSLYADIRGFGTWVETLIAPPLMLPAIPPVVAFRPQPRQYFKLSPNQEKVLASHYVDEPYPNKECFTKLSEGLDLHPEQTERWFERKRRAQKQQQQKRCLSQSDTTTSQTSAKSTIQNLQSIQEEIDYGIAKVIPEKDLTFSPQARHPPLAMDEMLSSTATDEDVTITSPVPIPSSIDSAE